MPDNAVALRKVLAQCAGTVIELPPGTLSLSPRGFEHGFDIAAGTSLQGARSTSPQPLTVFRIEDGGTYDSLFWVRNVSHVRIAHVGAEGSSFDSGCARSLDYGHAVYVRSDRGSSQRVSDVRIADDSFRNFNGLSWITLSAADGSPGIGGKGDVSIANSHFSRDSGHRGGCEQLGIAYSVAMIALHGSDDSGRGVVRGVSIVRNRLQAEFVKQGIAIWSGSEHLTVRGNEILNVGTELQNSKGELGRYAILIYNSAHERAGLHPHEVVVEKNVLENPVSCGIYVASGRSITIRNNDVSGQRDPNDAVLPKAAIALNHAELSLVVHNNLTENHVGIAVVGGSVELSGNRIRPTPDGTSVKISGL